MTTGELTARLDAGDVRAWGELHVLCAATARALGASDPDDVAASFVAQQFARGARDARRARPSTSLAAWVRGCLLHFVASERLRTPRRPVTIDDSVVVAAARETAVDGTDDRRAGILAARVAARLTCKQRDAYQCHVERISEREAARRLGISRDAFRERRDGALRALVRPADPRTWAHGGSEICERHDEPLAARILRLYASGTALGEIASATGLTRVAVRDRIRRLRRKFVGVGSARLASLRYLGPPTS